MRSGSFWMGFATGILAAWFWVQKGDDVIRTFENWFDKASRDYSSEEKRKDADNALR